MYVFPSDKDIYKETDIVRAIVEYAMLKNDVFCIEDKYDSYVIKKITGKISNGKLSGRILCYDNKGKLRISIPYENGLKNGAMFIYDITESPYHVVAYSNDMMLSAGGLDDIEPIIKEFLNRLI